ncbi:cytochrome P450 2M1-like [Oncorhynchus kisutch]|uniref:Cytochrome P450 2M1-like n=1 Tax=Oncorhynchus kisutch TaxID=8019 RepID=A0A8C7JMZ6_ONCKI|nr:cytochrome P450 2M1-like [Oncorhynchus kisutch]
MDLQHVLQTDILSIIMAIVVIILLWKYMGKQRSYGHLPPGPSLIPLLGNLLQMDLKRPDKSYMELSKKYGSVFTVWLGPKPVVVVSGYQAIKEALVDQGEEFNGRANPAITMKLFNEHGVGSSNGQRWKTLRNFSLTSLKNLGIGCRSLEERVQEEAKSLVKAFSEYGDSTVNPKELLFHTIINLFWSIVLGRRFEYNDPEFQIFYKPVYTYFDMLKSKVSMLYNISPRIVECFPGKHQELFKAIDKAKAYIRLEADRRLKSLDTSNPQDYFDVFLVKMLEEKDQPGTEFNYDNLFPCVWDLFAASTETLSSTLSHACLMMIKYPDIQEKVQKEIDEAIGSNRVPTADDRHKMPYTDAVIHEIQRSMCLAPTAVPHQMTRDTTFHNYHIPKGTTVFPLLSSVLFDPKLFKKPDEFDPENFLDENGRFKENNGFLAFGLGKRSCLGDGMGIPRMVLFLFFTSLLQRFTFRGTKPPEEIDDTVVSYFIGRLARPYTCYVKLRTANI